MVNAMIDMVNYELLLDDAPPPNASVTDLQLSVQPDPVITQLISMSIVAGSSTLVIIEVRFNSLHFFV